MTSKYNGVITVLSVKTDDIFKVSVNPDDIIIKVVFNADDTIIKVSIKMGLVHIISIIFDIDPAS